MVRKDIMEKQTGFLENTGSAWLAIGLVVVLLIVCAMVVLMFGLDISEVIPS